jgi:hypothetical protein
LLENNRNIKIKEEFCWHRVKEEKEKAILEALQKEMLKIKTKLDDLLEKYKDLNHVYVSNRLEEYDDLV